MASYDIVLYNSDMCKNDWQIRLSPHGSNRVSCTASWSWDTAPGLVDYDFLAIHSGRGSYLDTFTGNRYEVGPGSCLLLRKGRRYIGQTNQKTPMVVSFAHFEYVDAEGKIITPPKAAIGLPVRRFEKSALIFILLDRLLDASVFKCRTTETHAWFTTIILEYINPSAGYQDSSMRYPSGQAEEIHRLCRTIKENPGYQWRIQELAGMTGYCTDHLRRLFRRYSGYSPGEFIIISRIDASMSLLRMSNHSISQIAELLGYCDIYAFSRQFRQITGMTPTDYRRTGGIADF